MERRVGKKLIPIFLAITILIFSIFFVSCPNPFDAGDIRGTIASEVEIAATPNYKLIVESSSYGVSDPSGSVEVKDGYPIVLSATPFTTHGLIGWKQTGGPGTVTFGQVPGGVEVKVSGGNASISPIYGERPKVLYSTPIGNDIERNSNVALVFSTQVDLDSINSSTFKLLKSGQDQITDGVLSLSADGKIVKFNPGTDFNMYTNYVISVESEVNGFLNLADYETGNTIITSDTLTVGSTYTSAFRTGSQMDNTPPVAVSFTVTGTNDDPNYTGSEEVTLSNISATDSAGIAYVLVKNSGDPEYQAFSYDMYPTIVWPVPLAEGSQEIVMSFEDTNGLIVVGGTELSESIIVDFTPPTGSIVINGYDGSYPEFVPGITGDLKLSATDPDVDIDVRGSGESNNGSDTANRKEMRFANSSAAISGASWEAYATTKSGWTFSDSLEGIHGVYVQYKDAVENYSPIYKDTIYLDTTAPTGSFQIMNDGLVTNKEDPNPVTMDLSMSDGSGSGLSELQIEASPGLKPSTAWSTGGAASGILQGDGSTASAFEYDTSLNVILREGANSGGSDGSRIINLKVFDGAGNFRTISQTVTLDTTPPTGGSISINNGASDSGYANVTLYITPPAGDLTGIEYMAFANTNSPEPTNWIPAAATASWTLESATGGTKTVYAWFKDTAGNAAATPSVISDSINLDMTPPSGTITVSPGVTSSSTVTILCNVSGATQMRFSNNNASWSTWESYASSKSGWNITSSYGGSPANGTRYVYAQFRDAALNVQSMNDKFTYDNTAPSVSSLLINSGAAATNYYYVTLTQSASDNVYSAASLQMRFSNNGASYTGWYTYNTTWSNWHITSGYGATTAQGTKSVWIQVRDPMNNISTSRVDSIVYDTVIPATSPVINSGGAYTNNKYVTITLNASDASPSSGYYQMRFSNNNSLWSGWQSYATTRSSWDITSSTYGGTTTEGYKYVYVQLNDRAGNISTTRYDYIKYDITAPSGSFYYASGNPATISYMYTYVYFNMTDSGSGVAQRRMYHNETGWTAWEAYTSSKAWYVNPKNGLKYVYAQFMDGAGNTTSSMYDTVTLAETYSTLSQSDISSAFPGYTYSYYMNSNAIEGDDAFSSSALKPGTVLVYRTSAGRFGKLEVLGFYPTLAGIGNNVLYIRATTYGTTVSDKLIFIKGTYSCDLDTGMETSTGRDFFWAQNTSTQRDLVPMNGAVFAKWK